ncbi:IS1595 family transposase [Desulfovibrio sp. OttesenSCG-928-F07]|nr:IS1595 family transposase [Desulfovibrio sp. OttesenSCG-928-F07]
MPTVEEITAMIHALSAREKERLFSSFTPDATQKFTILEEARFTSGLFCAYCGCSENITKYGRGRGDKQRYCCNNCKRYFTAATDTFLACTKKSISVWQQYIKCMTRGLSIRKSAARCSINTRTAFMWRHKILDALARTSDKTERLELGGIVEADETFFALSFKGNKNKSFQYPNGRNPRKRGGECSTRGLSREKVCVLCAIERDRKISIARISGLGKISANNISKVLGGRIKKQSVLCTDGEKSYVSFTQKFTLNHIVLREGKAKKGVYHIQHINSFHGRLKDFIKVFRGVSTKHLNNYLEWNSAMYENGAKNDTWTNNKVWRMGLKGQGKTLYKDVCSKSAIPIIHNFFE